MYEKKFKSLFTFFTLIIMFHNSDAQICVQKLEGDIMLINLTVKISSISENLRPVKFNEAFNIPQLVKKNSLNRFHFPANLDKNTLDFVGDMESGIHTHEASENMGFTTQNRINTQSMGCWVLSCSNAMTLVVPLTLVAKFLYSRRHNSDFLHNKKLLAGVFLLFNLTMVSGQMWNQIKAPSFYHNSKNSPVYINDGSHGQFILESYIVATLSISFLLYLICCLWNILTIFYVFLVYYSQ